MPEVFDWLKPSRLWQPGGLDFRQLDFFQPRLLAFHSDTFMEDFFAAASAPQPDAFEATLTTPPRAGQALKLFQPMHGSFYLVCGSLCCRLPSFPDRDVRTAEGENTFFVLRKLVDGAEYAWVGAGLQKGWRPLNGQTRRVLPGEERHPLLTTTAANGRSLLFGYVPVASRETYNVPPAELATDTPLDPRVADLQARFVEPLTRPDPNTPSSIIEKTANSVALTLSVYLLLGLWEFLWEHVQDVAQVLRGDQGVTLSGENTQAKASLVTFLQTHALDGTPLPTPLPAGILTLAHALVEVARHQEILNQPGGGDVTQLGFSDTYNLKLHRPPAAFLDQLIQGVQNALSATPPPVALPKLEPQAGTLYVLRCVYERPQCDPSVQVVSQASAPFQLAPFFDPDAPGRPVRIPLPADVSIAGLRKLKKNVAFMMSEAMHKKAMSIAGQEKNLITEDQPSLSEPGGDFAFICSFSIQIIFIVAFFLLIMFVVILNFVFWWIAFFKICLPIPKRLLPGGG